MHLMKNRYKKYGRSKKKITCYLYLMLIGTLALTGFPFLSGFYSKDAIIEFAYSSNSDLGKYAAFVGILTAFLTSIYSWRLFFKTFHGSFNNKKMNIDETHESPLVMLIPLFILGAGSLLVGFTLKEIFIGNQSNDFWQNSIFFIKQIDHNNIPIWLLLVTPFLVIISIPLSFYYYISNTKILDELKNKNLTLYKFLLNKWYIDELYDLLFVNPAKKDWFFLLEKGDVGTIDKLGPDGISKLIKVISNKTGRLQTGFIYDYQFVMLIGLSILLTYLILN